MRVPVRQYLSERMATQKAVAGGLDTQQEMFEGVAQSLAPVLCAYQSNPSRESADRTVAALADWRHSRQAAAASADVSVVIDYARQKIRCEFPYGADMPSINEAGAKLFAADSGSYCASPREMTAYNFGPKISDLIWTVFLRNVSSVAEFGAGNGRFTLDWAARAWEELENGGRGPIVKGYEGAVGVGEVTGSFLSHLDLSAKHPVSPALPVFD